MPDALYSVCRLCAASCVLLHREYTSASNYTFLFACLSYLILVNENTVSLCSFFTSNKKRWTLDYSTGFLSITSLLQASRSLFPWYFNRLSIVAMRFCGSLNVRTKYRINVQGDSFPFTSSSSIYLYFFFVLAHTRKSLPSEEARA